MSWFTTPKTADICQCGHARCFHFRGWASCNEASNQTLMGDNQHVLYVQCRCVYFIKQEHAAQHDDVSELRKLAGLK